MYKKAMLNTPHSQVILQFMSAQKEARALTLVNGCSIYLSLGDV